jgi:hypothetical protein
MRRFLALGLLLWSVHAQAAPAPTLALITDKACADLDTESAFAKELRVRLPDVVLKVGATDSTDTWFLNWTPRGASCWLEIQGPESAELQIPRPAKLGDLELAASQVAWIMTMSVEEEPVEEEPVEEEPIAETPKEVVLEPPPVPPPLPVPTSESVPVVEDPAPTVEETPRPAEDIIEGGFVFTLVPGLSMPNHGSKKHVPGMALEIFSPGHFGIRGIELASIYASAGFVEGIQMAVGASRTGALSGQQISLGYNSADRVDGFQIAFGANNADHVDGFQIAFGANIAAQTEGFQIAFAGNIADEAALQIASVNVADHASVQIGLVNVSETSDVPIGLVNIMTDEPVFGTAWLGSSGLVVAGVLHGGKLFRYAYMVAAMPATSTDTQVAGFGLGVSLHFDFDEVFFDTELLGFQLAEDPLKQNFMLNLRGIIGWQLFDRFAVFAGPALVSYWSGALDGLGVQPGYSNESLGVPGSANRWDWAEIQAGVRF